MAQNKDFARLAAAEVHWGHGEMLTEIALITLSENIEHFSWISRPHLKQTADLVELKCLNKKKIKDEASP